MSKIKLKKYLDTQRHHVYAKTETKIKLDLTEYRDIDSDYGEDVGIEDIETVYKIPGFFTLEFPKENDSLDFFFPYSVYLNKADVQIENTKMIEIDFQPGELIFYANYKDSDTNIRVLKSLFENGAKYLGNKPDKLLTAIWQQMLSSQNVPWHHLEIIISQLYGVYDKRAKEYIPLRLTNEVYSKKYIMNIKESAHNLNPLLGFSYGYSKDALRTAVSKKKKQKNSFYEDIISGKFIEEKKEEKEKKESWG